MKRTLLVLFFSIVFSVLYSQTAVTCPRCWGYKMVTSMYGPVICPDCFGTGQIIVYSNPTPNTSNTYTPTQNTSNDQQQKDKYVCDVNLYTYNANRQRYESYGTRKLYKKSNNTFYVKMGEYSQYHVHDTTYPRSKDFNYWIVDEWGTTYYFD